VDKKSFVKKILDLCQEIYPLRIKREAVNWGTNVEEIFDFIKNNRLAHFYALKYGGYLELVGQYRDYEEKVANSLKKIGKVLKGREYMIIKTMSSYPHKTSDVDVLVKDENDEAYPVLIKGKNLWFVHMENKISWRGADAISNNFTWGNTMKYRWKGFSPPKADFSSDISKRMNKDRENLWAVSPRNFNFLVPNEKLDTLIRIAHVPFEAGFFRLGELLYIYNLLAKVDWQELKKEAKLMGWSKTFNRMENILEFLHLSLFGKPLFKKRRVRVKGKLNFPYQVPIGVLAGCVLEKRAWIKIWGGRYIIKDRINLWAKRNKFL